MAAGRPRTFDTAKALEAAMKVFWQRGYEGASVSELTRAMGINSPSLYAAFGSKDQLFKAVLDHYDTRREACLAEVLAAPTARDLATRLLFGLVELVTDPDEPPGCLFLQGGLSCAAGTEAIPRELARRRLALEATLRDRFAQAQADGELPATADPASLARYLGVVCNGIAVQAASGVAREPLRQVAELALQAWPTAQPPRGTLE